MRRIGLGVAASAGSAGTIATRSLNASGSTGSPPHGVAALSLSGSNFGSYDTSRFAIVMSFYGVAANSLHTLAAKDNGTEFQLFIDGGGKLNLTTNGGGNFVTTQTFTHDVWYTVKVWYDLSAPSDKVGVSVNGADVTAYDSFSNPGGAMTDYGGDMSWISDLTANDASACFLFMPAFFSGSVPSNAQVYGTRPLALLGLTGLWSIINSQPTDPIGYDAVKAMAWTNSGFGAYSTFVP